VLMIMINAPFLTLVFFYSGSHLDKHCLPAWASYSRYESSQFETPVSLLQLMRIRRSRASIPAMIHSSICSSPSNTSLSASISTPKSLLRQS
jgi:hypothetical protein